MLSESESRAPWIPSVPVTPDTASDGERPTPYPCAHAVESEINIETFVQEEDSQTNPSDMGYVLDG